jgi:hypothetical protein
VAGCCECGDEPSGSGTMELVSCVRSYYLSDIVTVSVRMVT